MGEINLSFEKLAEKAEEYMPDFSKTMVVDLDNVYCNDVRVDRLRVNRDGSISFYNGRSKIKQLDRED